jgi:HEAT repeat protein
MWVLLLAFGLASIARPPEDPCAKLMRGNPAMQDDCIGGEIARLGDRTKAQKAISMLVGLGTPAIPSLVSALKDREEVVRANAADALGRIGTKVPLVGNVVPALVKALEDEAVSVRQQAAGALAKMGMKAKDALPALQAAQQDSDALVRALASFAVLKMQKTQP